MGIQEKWETMIKEEKCGGEKTEREKKSCKAPSCAGQRNKVFPSHCNNKYTRYLP